MSTPSTLSTPPLMATVAKPEKQRNRKMGRKGKYTDDDRLAIIQAFNTCIKGGATRKEAAETTGVSHAQIYLWSERLNVCLEDPYTYLPDHVRRARLMLPAGYPK